MRQRLCALVLGAALASSGAGAAEEPAGAKGVLDAARKACAANGLQLNVAPEAIRTIDLTGDGQPDYLIDFNHATCEGRESVFCGTGGCELAIVVALRRGQFREVFHQQVLRYEIEPGEGARTIHFDLHGAYCGKFGPERCAKRQQISAKPFRFRKP
jgi:hypothetical protein